MSTKIKQLPTSERPYEKLEIYGPKILSNSELLAIIIKTGTKEESSVMVAQKLLSMNNEKNNLTFLQDLSIDELCKIKGIGKVKAIQIIAVCELAKRMSRPINTEKIKIRNTEDVAKLLMNELRYEKREIAKVIILNSKNIIMKIIDISYGGTSYAVLEPKEVLLDAIKIGAPKIILVHNHPSGDPTPSKMDYIATDKIYEAAEIMGIELLDHVIIGKDEFVSVFGKNSNNI